MAEVSENRLNEAIALLDRLLGVDVRKPRTAARLPAVVRVVESLEPAGGMEFPVFPASYAGDGQNAPPVYDLNGVEYGPDMEVIHGKDRVRTRRDIVKARQCTMDSPQSQANRTELAFLRGRGIAVFGSAGIRNDPEGAGEEGERERALFTAQGCRFPRAAFG